MFSRIACTEGAVTVFKMGMMSIDLTDAVLDYIATADLADQGLAGHAIWLGTYVRGELHARTPQATERGCADGVLPYPCLPPMS